MNFTRKQYLLAVASVLLGVSSMVCRASRESRPYERITLNITSDPATSVAVTWRSASTHTSTVVQVASALESGKPSEKVKSHKGQCTAFESDSTEVFYHSAVIRGLRPDTSYAYRVGAKPEWSKWHFFRTAARNSGSFSFIYLGDLQNRLVERCREVIDKAYDTCPDAAFILKVGDLVNLGSWDEQWAEWYAASDSVVRRIPIAPLPGNHEYGRSLTPFWRAGFTLPENGPTNLHETAYYFDCNGARIVAMNSMEKIEQQAKWLDNVLKDNTNNWTIVAMHYPLYSSTGARDNPRLRKHWQPVFDKRKVDIVFAGHDHTYSRTGFMKHEPDISHGKEASESESGTIYITSVSGPKFYPLNRRPYMRCSGEHMQLFQVVNIKPERLEYIAYKKNRKKHDYFVLLKGSNGATRLQEESCSGRQK
ncbi:MAG: fibronectin type III domain-containing protein [Verrucomicrobiota bacterium]